MTLRFQDARILADGARARALELGKALTIAAADYGGFVILIERMDGARPMTPDIASSKAYPAAVMRDLRGSPDENQQICEDNGADARLRQARAILAVR